MKKLLLSIVALLCFAMSASAGDVLYKTLTFPAEKQDSVNGYGATPWTATNEGLTWKFVSFNNYNCGWSYVRCGHGKNAYVATITTAQISEKISRFVVNFTKTDNNCINSAYLEVASDEGFTSNVQKITFTPKVGDVDIEVPTLVADSYYRLTIDCKIGDKNGFVEIKSIKLYMFDAQAVSAPSFTPGEGVYYDATDVTIANADGNDVYYSFDDASYTKYTAPVKVSETKTIYAYAQNGQVKSDKVQATFQIAETYASLSDLLQETPTTTGKPVSVTLSEEVADSFSVDYNSARNGVFFVNSATANGKFQLYGSGAPTNWNVGDKISGTAQGIYKEYNGQWEIALVTDGWALLSNGAPDAPKAPVITFNSDTKTVTITDPSGNDNTIYYTLDGTEPDDSKTMYEAPFTISATTTVQAVCYDDDDQKSSITTQVCTIVEALTNIAALKAACTATSQNDAPTVTFTLNDVKVAGVNGQSIFIQDATGSFYIFDKNKAAGVTKGDVLGGNITGALYAYNNMPEIVVTDFANMTKVAGEAPQPTKVNAADITKDDASRYVRFEGLQYVSTDSKNITLRDATGDIILYDKFSNLTKVTFSADFKYNMNLFVCPFKDDINYYLLYEEDIESVSEKDEAICRFDNFADNQLFNYATTKSVNYSFTIQSDAPEVVYESTDSTVATIKQLTIEFKGAGVATVSMAVPSTESFTAAKDSRTVRVYSGATGELTNPYCAGDVKALYQDGDTVKNVWVKAYIVGSADGAMTAEKVKFEAPGAETNLVIADSQDETNVSKVIPVELPKGDVRNALNLKDNATNLGKEVWLKGNIIKYFSQAGLKAVSEYTFDATVINHINAEDRIANDAIYNLAGQRVSAPLKGQVYIVGGKKVLY